MKDPWPSLVQRLKRMNARRVDVTHVECQGHRWLYFGGCDYLGMSANRRVQKAFSETGAQTLHQTSASRVTTGDHDVFAELEKALASFMGRSSACLFGSGYLAPLGVAQSLRDEVTRVLIDEKAHSALAEAALLSHLPIERYEHGNVEALKCLLNKHVPSDVPLVMTDGVWAHDGSVSDVSAILSLLPKQGYLLVDDSHGVGVVGRHGQGASDVAGRRDSRLLVAFSLSKAFGLGGGVVVGGRRMMDRLKTLSGAYSGSTPTPLPVASALLVATHCVARMTTARARFRKRFSDFERKVEVSPKAVQPQAATSFRAPIYRLKPDSRECGLRLFECLRQEGIFPPLIQYPAGTAEAYFRFSVSLRHTRADLDRLARAILNARTDSDM